MRPHLLLCSPYISQEKVAIQVYVKKLKAASLEDSEIKQKAGIMVEELYQENLERHEKRMERQQSVAPSVTYHHPPPPLPLVAPLPLLLPPPPITTTPNATICGNCGSSLSSSPSPAASSSSPLHLLGKSSYATM